MTIMDILQEKTSAKAATKAEKPTRNAVTANEPSGKKFNFKPILYGIIGIILVGVIYLVATSGGDQSGTSPDAAITVTGANVNFVAFGNLGEDPVGSFRNLGNMVWVEEGANGEQRFTYSERQRDEWSVFLYDESQDVEIELDIYNGEVKYRQGEGQQTFLHSILTWTD